MPTTRMFMQSKTAKPGVGRPLDRSFMRLVAGVFWLIGISAAAAHDATEGHGGGDGVSQNYVYHEAGSSENYVRGPTEAEFLLTAAESNGRFTIAKIVFHPGVDSYPGHTHLAHSEVFYIMSGRLQFTVNDDTRVLGPGDLVYYGPDAPHALKVIGDEPVHTLIVYEPGGYENYYLKRKKLIDEERDDPAAMKELAIEYDVFWADEPK